MKKYMITAAAILVLAVSMIAPAFAEDGGQHASAAMKNKQVDIACVKTAVTTREDALIAKWGVFNTSIGGAYSARKTALLASWDKTDAKQRKEANKAAWKAFTTAKKTAVKQWNTDRKAAWSAFRTAVKACKGDGSIDAGGEGLDQ